MPERELSKPVSPVPESEEDDGHAKGAEASSESAGAGSWLSPGKWNPPHELGGFKIGIKQKKDPANRGSDFSPSLLPLMQAPSWRALRDLLRVLVAVEPDDILLLQQLGLFSCRLVDQLLRQVVQLFWCELLRHG